MRNLVPQISAALICACLAIGAPAQDAGPSIALVSGPVLTLGDAIKLALKRNKNILVSSYNIGISGAQLLAARGVFDPAIVGNRSGADYQEQSPYGPTEIGLQPVYDLRQDNYEIGLSGQTPIGTTYQIYEQAQNFRYSFYGYQSNYEAFGGIQITQHLLKGFGFDANLANVRIAKANRSIQDWVYKQTAITQVTNVIVAYSNLLLAHDQLNAARRNHDLAAALLDANEKEYKVGKISQSDVVDARAYLATYEEPILIAVRSVRDNQNQLRELIGDEVFLEEEPLLTLVPTPVPEVQVDLKADLAKALALRPDYQRARLGIVQNRATEAADRNALLPQVDFIGGYGYNGFASTLSASRIMVGQRDNPSYSAGLQVTIPLTFSVGRGTFRAARLQREMAEEDLKRREEDIAVAVAQAAGQIETTRRRVLADQAAYELANKALDGQEKKKRAGSGTTLEVIQQQEAVSLAESNVASALAAQRQAVALYDQTLGTTLERYNIKLAEE